MVSRTRLEHALLRVWHAWAAGGFLVAYVTAGEDTYAMHQFAGYAVLAAFAARLLAGVLAPANSPWRLPRPGLRSAWRWLPDRRGRHPLFAWLAAALIVMVGTAAVTGSLADSRTAFEHFHESASEVSLWVIFCHIAFVAFMYGGRRRIVRAGGVVAAWWRAPRPSKETPR